MLRHVRAVAIISTLIVGASLAPVAQQTPPQPRVPDFPQRPPAPKDVLERGKAVYGVNCSFCHGSEAKGGETGPNLLRSNIVLQDKDGELIAMIVHGGRADRG